MFTGIVESLGTVARVERRADCCDLVIEAGAAAQGAKAGDSVAVNGACLTVTCVSGEALTFQAVAETLQRTNLGDLAPGSAVNLERAVRADQRLDGHVVQGHVDATGRIRSLERRGDDVRLAVACEPAFADLLVDKGSVTIDGVSLTVVSAEDEGFDVALIPHTLAVTTLGRRRPGDRVNLEADVLGKYVKKYVDRVLGKADGR
ncbi:MAG: riboflavin synthase [Deltaproteobacteria bacterium]|nr:riboflavin synthase [Deltaproteobacteria bacterium]